MTAVRDYGQDQESVKQFLREFTYITKEGESVQKYVKLMTEIANRKLEHLFIDMTDLEQFNFELSEVVKKNTIRYVKIFHSALDELLPFYKTESATVKDSMDIFIEQRLLVAGRNHARPQVNSTNNSQTTGQPTSGAPIDVHENEYPPELIRRFDLSFKPSSLDTIPIRSVMAEQIGKLVTIRGIVTRVTDVRPRIKVVTYTCDLCGCESFQVVDGSEFTPLFDCSSSVCRNNKTPGRITQQTRGSRFIKSQDIKLQEHSDQVPTGHIPRTVTIQVHGELTRQCAPGDHVSVSGVFLAVEKTSFRARTGGLAADTYIEAHYLAKMNKTEDDEMRDDAMSMEEAFGLAQAEKNFLSKLSSSIAPEIFGHEELKTALLLLLVGGVDRSPHGMKIRGNINICLMGDPGVAKSQLLSFIDRLAPRCQYTTGRGSSGVGLTAAVLKDAVTNELVLEGGALVLADQGICCIDEFDKMMDSDRTAIHEVMEQQTVSIAKAGIMTTLNARVSILAAANPAYGRYNSSKTITENLQLPPALLSRFDLLWLIRDRPCRSNDLDLAQHVTYIHKNPSEPAPNEHNAFDMNTMRRYINLCKSKSPVVPTDLEKRLVKIYLDIRARRRINKGQDALFTSPRSLLAIIRLSTAFARLRLSDVVEEADVAAAVDLYNHSRDSIEGAIDEKNAVHTNLMGIIQSLTTSKQPSVSMADFKKEAYMKGFDDEQIRDALGFLDESDTLIIRDDVITVCGR